MVITSKLALKLFVVFILAKEIYDNRNKTTFTFLKIEIETMIWQNVFVITNQFVLELVMSFYLNFHFSENVFAQTRNHAIEFEMLCFENHLQNDLKLSFIYFTCKQVIKM